MPIKKAAQKALRQSQKRRQKNLKIKNRIKSVVRQVNDLLKAGKGAEAEKVLQKVYSALDKAVKKKTLKKKTVARKKSRLARAINKAKKAAGKEETTKKA